MRTYLDIKTPPTLHGMYSNRANFKSDTKYKHIASKYIVRSTIKFYQIHSAKCYQETNKYIVRGTIKCDVL